ncbi:hypothetical protein ID866_8990 [Astraeus odoratus]|nr:hypothetical protein ID866_8990 [Astraeus odoratus]
MPERPLYEYEVQITPNTGTSRRMKRRIFQLAEKTDAWRGAGFSGTVAHDNSSRLLAPLKLEEPLTITLQYYEDGGTPASGRKVYTLTVTFTKQVDTICLANYTQASTSGRTGVGFGRNKYFFRAAKMPSDLGGGLEAWTGYSASARLAHKQVMVNINVCTAAFYATQNLAQAMIPFGVGSSRPRMNEFCRGTIKEVSKFNATQYKFMAEEFGEAVTVYQFFQKKHRITLKHPHLLLVDVGANQKKVLLPPELCEILPDQPFRGKLTDEQTTAMIGVASFGIKIGSEMAVVPGRILPRPGIKYRQGSPFINEKASWNLKDVKFASSSTLKTMAVLIILDGKSDDQFSGRNDQTLHRVVTGFRETCGDSGMTVTGAPIYLQAILPPKDKSDPLREAAIRTIHDTLRPYIGKFSIVMVVLADRDKAVYDGIKHLCDVELGIGTICVQSSKIKKQNIQYYANVALKLNAKLGGINHKLDDGASKWLNDLPTMVVGMDVTHPGPGSVKGTPSIAAVVASVDNQCAQYPCALEIQKSREEMILDLEKMMIGRLKLYKAHNKERLPERVVVYRDGVSEGQFKLVREKELPKILGAFKKFDSPRKRYRPKLTIVICGKRHHTRFYATEESSAAQDGNPLAGTVVDRGVTSVYHFDFFLQAHGGLKGTTRPTHYYVVHDENSFDADTLQGLTHSLSYMFARATKAVSLVSPAYYADIACERGRCYLRKLLQGYAGDGTTASSRSEDDVMKEARNIWRNGVHKNLEDTMFYL